MCERTTKCTETLRKDHYKWILNWTFTKWIVNSYPVVLENGKQSGIHDSKKYIYCEKKLRILNSGATNLRTEIVDFDFNR